MNTKKLLLKLSKRFPKRYAKFYHDYVGLMTGKLPEEVHNIILCLDFDYEVLPLVKENKPDLIITHHPFIYGTKAKVFKWDKLKEQLCNEIDAFGVPVYSMHTNFDSGKDGMNDALAEALGLENIYCPEEKDFCMRIGELKEAMPIEEFAQFANNTKTKTERMLNVSLKEKISYVIPYITMIELYNLYYESNHKDET